jgi:hypothetical protein
MCPDACCQDRDALGWTFCVCDHVRRALRPRPPRASDRMNDDGLAGPAWKREPSADIRQAAATIHQIYTGLVDEGFTERQALIIVGQILAANA